MAFSATGEWKPPDWLMTGTAISALLWQWTHQQPTQTQPPTASITQNPAGTSVTLSPTLLIAGVVVAAVVALALTRR